MDRFSLFHPQESQKPQIPHNPPHRRFYCRRICTIAVLVYIWLHRIPPSTSIHSFIKSVGRSISYSLFDHLTNYICFDMVCIFISSRKWFRHLKNRLGQIEYLNPSTSCVSFMTYLMPPATTFLPQKFTAFILIRRIYELFFISP